MKILKYLLFTLLALIALWFSFYTEPLSAKHEREALKEYKPEQLVDHYWSTDLAGLDERALPLGDFLSRLQADAEALRASEGHVLGIGSNVCYVLKGEASTPTFSDDAFHFTAEGIEFTVPTKYIFGNVAREACGWFNIDDFQNTMDFNSVSACMNQRIREQVIADKPQHIQDYSHVRFCGAIEVQPGQSDVRALTLYPYILEFD